ncbi:SRPBCC family protein [Nocardia sp. CDC159]|uniref:SRPBCC family protein n=1 Tax=Nocardia pulmonis TaxID=2951408 RepID=A0A9X2J077_9NOCA|nr:MULTISPECIES: SRPBCC family protein [Nocardia]MCM6778882.1 SRPBCC family protein [Nocardia pulmonis]MCM6791771.1 SRPBCC family protein [Nocardia sp. CDC159]
MDVVVEKFMKCTSDEYLDFVMDVERYAEVDDKITKIDWIRRTGNVLQFKFRPALPGMPRPMPKMVLQLTLTPGKRIDLTLAPPPHNKLANPVMKYTGSFVCAPAVGGTMVTSSTSLAVVPPLRWVIEPILRRNLPQNFRAEMEHAKAYIEKLSAGKG